MKKLNRNLMITIILGTIIVSAVTIERTSNYINELENEIKQSNEKISNFVLRNDNLLLENKNLSQKNKELEYKIDDISFKTVSFNPNDVTSPSHIGSKQLEIVFNSNDRYNALKGLEQSFIDAERQYGVNAIFLLGIVSQESSYGTSNRAINDNNLAGIEVYSNLSKGKLFNSKSECVFHIAKLLSKDYLNNGKYYKGKDIYSINDTYCVTPHDKYEWSKNIINISNKYVDEINNI